MNPTGALLAFGAEFVGFLAAAATLAIVLLRTAAPDAARGGESPASATRAGRATTSAGLAPAAIVAGLAALGGAAFVSGARLVDDVGAVAISVPRGVGAVLLAGGALRWNVGRRSREGVWFCSGLAASSIVAAQGGPSWSAHALAGAAGIGLVVHIVETARQSVAARIAASGAATLLVLLLVLSVALSAVLESTLRGEAVRRLQVRAKAESSSVNDSIASVLRDGFFLANTLQAGDGLGRLTNASSDGRLDAPLSAEINSLSRTFQGRAYLFAAPAGAVVAQAFIDQLNLNAAGLNALTGTRVVVGTTCANGAQVNIEFIGTKAFVVAVTAICSIDKLTFAGRLVAVVPLDDKYVGGRRKGLKDESVSLGLYRISGGGSSVPPRPPSQGGALSLASDGDQPIGTPVAPLIATAARTGQATSTFDGRFVAVAPVDLGTGAPRVLAVIVSSPTASIAATRDRLFGVLFAIALGGTLLALLFAALVGERIGSRLRRLTVAADLVSRGTPGVQAEVGGGDEVGTLGATFDQMARSIDEKTAAEVGLRGRIEAVVAEMGEALVAVDGAGLVTDWNRAAEDLIGVRASHAIGRGVAGLLRLKTEDGTDLACRLTRPPQQRWSSAGLVTTVEGALVPVAASGGTLRDAEGVTSGAVVVLRDLRGEREVERMKTEFLSRVGHELRTPLTGVLGYAEMLLRREWPPERALVMIGEIATSGRRLERIVRMLEFFAADAAGRSQMRLATVEPRTVVDAVLARWTPQVSAPLSLARRVRRDLPTIEGDAQWLALALGELVDNARKFSPAGGRIIVAAGLDDRGRIELSVTDRGVGMTSDQIARAFEAFAQGDASDTRRFDGLGLGLSLVQSVAEGHGGDVQIASVAGRGSRLSIVVPQGRNQQTPAETRTRRRSPSVQR